MNLVAKIYRTLNDEKVKKEVERFFILLAFALFILHLVIITIAKLVEDPPFILQLVNKNYLAALYTPFSIILLYEVYFMILALPLSFTESINRQYQIISLIIIRRVFKDISKFDSFAEMTNQTEELIRIALDLGCGLGMYLLIAVFLFLSSKKEGRDRNESLNRFIQFKELVTVGLTVLLAGLAMFAFAEWLYEVYADLYLGAHFSLKIDNLFFEDLFSIMIFTDVLIFIASFLYSNAYSVLFRNAGFVVSTVLIRISLTVHDKYGVLVAVAAVLVGNLVQAIYLYFQKIEEIEYTT